MKKILFSRYCTVVVLSVLTLTLGITECFANPFFADTSVSNIGYWEVSTTRPTTNPITEDSFFVNAVTTDAFNRGGTSPDWIANNAAGYNGGVGSYVLFVFSQSFDLTGYDPATAVLSFQWEADDSGSGWADRGTWIPQFQLNNNDLVTISSYIGPHTGCNGGGYPSCSEESYVYTPEIISSGFNPGANNILRFYVEGNGQTDGMGLKSVTFTANTSGPIGTVPEPTSLILLGTGLGVLGLTAWRRRK